MVKLSIVIPYYETYKMTKKLIDNLLLQRTKEIEIIIVDDYCKKEFHNYIIKDNVKVIEHETNTGVSKSRNDGIKVASGKYIAFVDSDDMVMPDYVERLLELIDTHNEDIIVFNWVDITNNELNRHPHNPAVWKAIYKKDILPKFDETLRVREDYFYQKELANKNPTIYYYDRVLYIYNSGREGSLWWNETHK